MTLAQNMNNGSKIIPRLTKEIKGNVAYLCLDPYQTQPAAKRTLCYDLSRNPVDAFISLNEYYLDSEYSAKNHETLEAIILLPDH